MVKILGQIFIHGMYGLLAEINNSLHNYDATIEYCNKANKVQGENIGINSPIVNNAYGGALLKKGNRKEALSKFNLSYNYCQMLKDSIGMANALNCICSVYNRERGYKYS